MLHGQHVIYRTKHIHLVISRPAADPDRVKDPCIRSRHHHVDDVIHAIGKGSRPGVRRSLDTKALPIPVRRRVVIRVPFLLGLDVFHEPVLNRSLLSWPVRPRIPFLPNLFQHSHVSFVICDDEDAKIDAFKVRIVSHEGVSRHPKDRFAPLASAHVILYGHVQRDRPYPRRRA